MQSILKNPALAPEGEKKIRWAQRHMPVLSLIRRAAFLAKPLRGLSMAVSVHLEAKTACLCQTLAAGGAEVWAMGSNPLSTQDDVCAALAASGVGVLATHGCTAEAYHDYLVQGLQCRPHLLIDDGGDMVHILHEEKPDFAGRLLGGCEETTTASCGCARASGRAGSTSPCCWSTTRTASICSTIATGRGRASGTAFCARPT